MPELRVVHGGSDAYGRLAAVAELYDPYARGPMKTKTARISRLLMAGACCCFALSAQADSPVLHVLNWSELIPQTVQQGYSQQHGTQMTYDILDSDDALEGKLLTGNSGYDVVYPSSSYMEKQVKAGVYEPLDWSQIPNRVHLDPLLLQKLEVHDPGNRFGVPFLWGTNGILVNVAKVRAILGDEVELNTQALLFDPEVVSQLSRCGVSFLDSPQDVFTMALAYLGRDPNSEDLQDYEAAYTQLQKVWPHIRQVNSTYRDQIARGDICVAMAWSGDAGVINRIVRENDLDLDIRYFTPRGQTPIWFTMMGIPKDARNKSAAYQWINYLLQPDIATEVAEYNGYPSSVKAAQEAARALKDGRYAPSEAEIRDFYMSGSIEPKTVRVMTRYWRKLHSQ